MVTYCFKAFLVALSLAFCSAVFAQTTMVISPALKQEYADAKMELDNALRLPNAKFVQVELSLAQSNLRAAEAAQTAQDASKFTQFTRLARAQAQYAVAAGDLKAETERSTDTSNNLQRAKEEISILARKR
jgi:hypothetical protein